MNKTELTNELAGQCGLAKNKCGAVVENFCKLIVGELAAGHNVQLLGFGSFTVAERAAGERRNPRTGEMIQVAAKKVPKFKPAKALRDAVNPVPMVGGARKRA